MQEHEKRMLEEATTLKLKTDKLLAFLDTEIFNALNQQEQKLLAVQLNAMMTYFGILVIRLNAAGIEVSG
jgi:regulator of replication initiation timing